jgi:probable phosphoglycerate mutase
MVGLLYLMRHGESTVNVAHRLTCRQYEGDLTEKGSAQAQHTADWLADKGILHLYASPFHRAEQTAAIVGKILGLTHIIQDDLCEIDCGDLEGKTDDDSWMIWRKAFDTWLKGDWEARYPNGESLREAFNRYSRILALAATHDENTVLITHGGMMRAIVPFLCVNAAALQRIGGVDNTGFVILEPYDVGRYICKSWNLIDHLTPNNNKG